MSRLITFGDSFTYGHHLVDNNKQAWPAVLGTIMNLPVVNVAQPGSSNVEILAEILNFEFKDNDLVIIGWTFVERDIVFKKEFFVPGRSKPKRKKFFKIFFAVFFSGVNPQVIRI